ncbi:MAG: hypothetical protein ACYTG7_25525, partial [Planctomycetota bacterium]
YVTAAKPYPRYCCIEGGWFEGTGNIDEDPQFLDPGQRDFHLTYGSPCIDAGLKIDEVGWEDFEGDERKGHYEFDIGADEFHNHLYCTGDFEPGGDIKGMIVGQPGTQPLGIVFGTSLLDKSIHTEWGYLYLAPPHYIVAPLGVIPSNGILVLPTTITSSIPAPYDYYMQALIGLEWYSLSNVFVVEVR